MHTVERLEEALAVAENIGYAIRQEWLGGNGGGGCHFAGKKWIFVDLALTHVEQLDQVAQALRDDPATYQANLSPSMRQLLDIRDAA